LIIPVVKNAASTALIEMGKNTDNPVSSAHYKMPFKRIVTDSIVEVFLSLRVLGRERKHMKKFCLWHTLGSPTKSFLIVNNVHAISSNFRTPDLFASFAQLN
jgi:hypothetical protein